MIDSCYWGGYVRFDTVSKNEGMQFIGADNLNGDIYEIVFEDDEGFNTAYLKNRFGAQIAFLDPETSHRLSVLQAKGFSLNALLSFVGYTETPSPGHFWGEVGLICYDTSEQDSFKPFIERMSSLMSEGMRPNLDLGKNGLAAVLENKGKWTPPSSIPLPEFDDISALVKKRRSFSDQLVEMGRAKNKGCYFGSLLFFVAIFALIAFSLKSCGVL